MKEYKRIEVTPQGYYYASVTKSECLSWGGLGVCDLCGKDFDNGKLIFVLSDCICDSCFNSWLQHSNIYEEDLKFQKERSEDWFKYHLGDDVLMPWEYCRDRIEDLHTDNKEKLERVSELDKIIADELKKIVPEKEEI